MDVTFVRVCPRHGTPIRWRYASTHGGGPAEVPWCVRGRHVPDGWAVVDVVRPAVWACATIDAICLAFDIEGLPTRPAIAVPRGQLAGP